MPRKWFEEKAETPNPEIQKPASKDYDKNYSGIFKKMRDKIDAIGRPGDVQKQVNYREGFDHIWSDDNDKE